MSLKAWREIARPHKDVLEGTFKQSEFAADISQVASGTAQSDYQDAEKFFSRTYITEGMRLLLISVAQRLAGKGGDPVIQLQTAFGGGKTHTMLAVLHLASRTVPTDRLEGIPTLLDEADIQTLPTAKVAVIDGIRLSPNQPQKHGAIEANTLWGELAYQLLGTEGYDMVAESDASATSPGKEVLRQLIEKSAPCVILIDELVAFVRQLEFTGTYKAGSFETNMSFIQALTEAMKAVPNAILLASLPESEVEVGGNMGQRALESLEKFFARVESVWKPVASTEAFEIVRRRLFEHAGTRSEVEGICRQFANLYRDNSDKFPIETQNNDYFERLCQSYPIHPEVFDRLYEDWSTLDKFQRTRGVLQYMAIVIHRLWVDGNKDALILPGSIALDDTNVRNKSIHYLPQGWEPVIEKEVDGPRSEPTDIDNRDTRFGGVQAARRTMRTIFLGSAPSNALQGVKGVDQEHILLGAVQPGQVIGTFEDVLKRLRDRLHYLYSENDRFYLDTRPNLRREMESRRQNINEQQELLPQLKTRVSNVFGKGHCFAGVHVFTPSVDVPDDYGVGPRLVVLPPSAAYSRGGEKSAQIAAEEILRKRGDQPRQKQNRLIFFAADYDSVSRLKDSVRVYLAWRSITQDVKDGKLDLTMSLSKQAERNLASAEEAMKRMVRDAYKWILCPVEEFVKGKPELEWECVSVSTTSQNLIGEIENKLKEEEWLISNWSPVFLKNLLEQWYFKDDTPEISPLKVWQDSCNYLYMPRLVNDNVFKETIRAAIQSEDYFAFATGKDGDRYLGFNFGRGFIDNIDTASLLIEKNAAEEYRERTKPAPQPEEVTDVPVDTTFPPYNPEPTGGNTDDSSRPVAPVTAPSPDAIQTKAKRHFYGTIDLDPVQAKMKFADIIDEVVEQFTAKLGVEVEVSVEIRATAGKGFDEALQRAIKENCNVLKFSSSEFEE